MSVRSRWIDVAWALFTNLFVLSGVIAWGWPPGNVFVLFWIENVILGAVTAVRILTAEGADAPGSTDGPRWATAGFFVMHYGIFALVHGAFVAVIAIGIGLSWDWWTLGLPAVVIALRYLVDLATVWFLGGQRRSVGPGQAFASPYPRLIVLHFATLLGFAFAMPFGRTASFIGQLMAQAATPVQRVRRHAQPGCRAGGAADAAQDDRRRRPDSAPRAAGPDAVPVGSSG